MSKDTTDIASRLRAISTSPVQYPGLNSRIRDTCSDGAAEIDRLREALAEVVKATDVGAYFTARRAAGLAIGKSE